MGAVGASAFVFRDFLKYILPTILAACLFVPFVASNNSKISVDLLVFSSAISGYIIYSPVAIISNRVQSWMPSRLNLKQERQQAEWLRNNWDYNELWAILDKDEREYAYLTQSYLEFYQTMGFYLLIYSLSNLLSIIINWYNESIVLHDFNDLFLVKTRMIGDWYASTIIVAIASFILAMFMFMDVILEYGALYLENGIYVRFAAKYQKSQGGLARSVWGEVYEVNGFDRKPVSNVEVHLLREDSTLIGWTRTNTNGQFQIVDAFEQCVGTTCKAAITEPHWSGEHVLNVSEKTIPSFGISAVNSSRSCP